MSDSLTQRIAERVPRYRSDWIYQSAVDRVLTARDFCGNEAEALEDWQDDENIVLNTVERFEILDEVNRQWNAWRKAAGVKIKK